MQQAQDTHRDSIAEADMAPPNGLKKVVVKTTQLWGIAYSNRRREFLRSD